MRRFLIGALLLGACNNGKPAAPEQPAEPITRTTTTAALNALPQQTIANGRLVCLAQGGAPCHATDATANWLRDGKYATWEAHQPILIWTPDKTDPELLGEVGPEENRYDVVLSVAATPSGYVVLNLSSSHALLYDQKGRYTSSLPMPQVSVSRARGYSGSIAFLQVIHETGRDSAAAFEVREVDGPGDTVGTTVLKTTLPWLRLRDSRTSTPVPLFPTLPSYAIADDSDIVWGNSALFNFERQSAKGVLRWRLTGNVPGPAITPAEIAALRAKLPPGDAARRKSFDSSAAHTGKFFPATSGLYVGPDGRVLVAGALVPSHDSVDYFLLGNTGEPTGRFALPVRTRPLLFAGDSVLVQRAGANTNQELRWLVIKKP